MDRVRTPDEALAGVPDGATVAIAGFGVGHRFPSTLIQALAAAGPRRLRIVANSLGSGPTAPEALVTAGLVDRLVVSFSARPGRRSPAEDRIAAGEIELEIVPQGILVERLRAAGAGLPAFYSPTTVGTSLAEGKETRVFGGREHVLEQALPVDVALLRAHRADRSGNVEFRGATRNFNPSFAAAARVAIVKVDEIVERGGIPAEAVGLPDVLVTHVVRSRVSVVPDAGSAGRRPPASRRTYLGRPALTRAEMARRVADLLPDGGCVNLGAGLPTLASVHLRDRDVRLHAENGVLGYGPQLADGADVDADLFDAGGGFVAARPGMSFFDSVTSFEIARSGRLSAVVLGGYQVDAAGDLANWTTPGQVGGGVGGAMDLVAGGSTLVVVMEHCDSRGRPKLVERCTYPVTGRGCVDVVVTDLGVFCRGDDGFVLEEIVEGFTPDEVFGLTGLTPRVSPGLTVLAA
jgi:3-oxoacid CoA-transferase